MCFVLGGGVSSQQGVPGGNRWHGPQLILNGEVKRNGQTFSLHSSVLRSVLIVFATTSQQRSEKRSITADNY